MSRPAIACTYWFGSSTNPNSVEHETLLYVDRSVSCSCLGWTRRCDVNGNRSCKHTRLVLAGVGHETALRYHVSKENLLQFVDQNKPTTTKTTTAPAILLRPGQRKMIIE